MPDIASRVKTIISEQMCFDIIRVIDSASIIDDLGADSLDMFELLMAAEEEFGIEVLDDDADAIVTVGDAVKYFEKHVSA